MTDEENTEPERSEVEQLTDEVKALRKQLAAAPRDPAREAGQQILDKLNELEANRWSVGGRVFENGGDDR